MCFVRLPDRILVRCLPGNGSWPEGLAWTAAGDALIGSSVGNTGSRVWRYDLKDARFSLLASGEDDSHSPAVSRQGHLAYVLSTRNANLWQANLTTRDGDKGNDVKQIASSSRWQSDPSFSPDRRHVAFLSDRSGSQEIWITDIDKQASSQLTHFEGPPTGSPSWSPDGTQIAFDSEQDKNTQIYVVPSAGGPIRQITWARGENVVPSWSQDGKFVYFASSRTGEFQIWKCKAAGGDRHMW